MESLGGEERRDSGKEVFLSRSTAAQSHMQRFPLAETHFAHTCTHHHACVLLYGRGRTAAIDCRVLGVRIRHDSSTSTKNIRLKVKRSALEHIPKSHVGLEPTTL